MSGDAVTGERLIQTHPVNDAKGDLVGIMLIVRNLEYLSQVQSTVRYSRKLAALGRLSAGVAHEVKNPLNAMAIHLELLRQQFSLHARGGGTAGRRRIRPASRQRPWPPSRRSVQRRSGAAARRTSSRPRSGGSTRSCRDS